MTKTKSTKRALLMSALALLMCVSMLIGSTFAWFTDSVTSAGNKIQAGTLDVQLLMDADVDGEYDDISNSTSPIFGAGSIAQNNNAKTLWEPGKTQVAYLAIKNNGNLALKYTVGLNVQNVSKDLYKVMEYAIVADADKDAPVTAWTSGNSVVEGTQSVSGDVSLAVGATHYFALVIHMDEAAGNEYQGGEVNFDLTVLATQDTVEADSFNNQYDKNAGYDMPWDGVSKTEPVADENGVYHITTAAELVGMMDVTGNSIYIGKTIVLENNIDLGGKTVKGIGGQSNFAGTFDGQGFTISNFKIDATDREYYAGLFNYVGNCGTVKNLTVKNATVMGTSQVGAVAGGVNGGPNDSSSTIDNCKAIDCTVVGVKKVGAVVGYSMGSSVTNNYAENCTVLYSEKEGGEVLGYENTGSTVKNNTYKNVTVAKGASVSTADELQAALANGGEVVLAADINMDVTATGLTVAKDSTAKLDLNGHDIIATSTSANSVQLLSVNGNLDIVGNGTISLTNDDLAWSESYRYAAINIGATGVVTLGEGVNVVCEAGSNDTTKGCAMAYAVDIYTTGTLNVNGASLHSNYIAVRCFYGASVVNVNSGSITSSRNNWGIWPQSAPGAVITIADGITYTTDSYGIYIFD